VEDKAHSKLFLNLSSKSEAELEFYSTPEDLNELERVKFLLTKTDVT